MAASLDEYRRERAEKAAKERPQPTLLEQTAAPQSFLTGNDDYDKSIRAIQALGDQCLLEADECARRGMRAPNEEVRLTHQLQYLYMLGKMDAWKQAQQTIQQSYNEKVLKA